MAVNHNTYITHYVRDTCDEDNVRTEYRASLALPEQIHEIITVCMAASICIQLITSVHFAGIVIP